MKFNGLRLLSMLLVSSLNVVSGHECLNLKPMEGFEMEKFLGPWNVIKTTLPLTRCLVFDIYTQKIENIVDHAAQSNFDYLFGSLEANTSLSSQLIFTDLEVDYSTNPEKKKPSFIVFDTNYESYAGVYICSKKPTGFQHYIAIMSRSLNFDKEIINKLMVSIFWGHNSPADLKLKNVDHTDCNYENINDNSNDQNVIEDGIVYISIKWIPHVEPAP
ncbi:uncharacterized protein LOC126847148 isoform X1 [Adelges cooleyi]|uniref:uncharacterized protein LOC126847148 isoform X1 n=1 Tax=Adelges cooleyi TaxID=133065 RepID=UPI00217FD666|nr:uncharacterized protein LOC126847148 isoform X1 [Adelges cooleyi]XP_050443197.1 uncharacterized protein LOC126847148 isoform X1 [Adelges cooleyi]